MEFKEAVKIALQSLWANKLRTVLTLLGVVIGVASVIAVVTLVNGANTYVTTKFIELWRGRVHGVEDAADHHQLGGLSAVSEAQEHPVRRLQVRARELQALRRDWRAAGDDGEDRAGDAVDHRHQIRGYTWQMPALQNLNIVQGRGFTRGG